MTTTAPHRDPDLDPTPVDDEEIAAWRAFLRAHSLMLRQIGEDLEAAGLPPLAWYDVLWALYEAPARRLQNYELADAVLLSRSGLSRLVDRIADAGLVRRTDCPEDRRGVHIELTDEGAAMLRQMWPVYARGIAEHFAPALGRHSCTVRQAFESVAASLGRGEHGEPC
ncbi:MAG TPA: MarR family transcriptional regulator [Solirubrobacterales bacterium]|nr:MarR family transcriptional regulator [Solirubrobacterales bacterium]